MISIFVMYSADREEAFSQMLPFLGDMEGFPEAQKTLVVDGRIDVVPAGWDAVFVPRIGGRFCWSRMWDAGVATARHETVAYFDSDRLLPPSFLVRASAEMRDDTFVFTGNHWQMLRPLTVEQCRRFHEESGQGGVLMEDAFLGALKFERRQREPFHGPAKNVMSGSTVFPRSLYIKLGGVDPWYCGHGAFADTDFHFTAAKAGCRFVDLKLPELHYPHGKLDDKKNPHTQKELYRLALDNFIYYCVKWGHPLSLAEDLAMRSFVESPSKYVAAMADVYGKSQGI